MGKALYRKYRPKTLGEVVGESHITEPLENALKSGKISHAYLFVGPRGCGKTSVARIFAHAVNNFEYELEDNYVDIIEIDGASNRGIDNIRELREKVAIAPTKGKYKIYIIDEVHMLTKEAFNALLKTIEEPPAHAIFIMATTDFNKVPVTITSRAQIFQFKLASADTMFAHLKAICEKEKIDIEDEAIRIVVKRGGGSFRDSLSLLDQISTISSSKITAENLLKALGLPADEAVKNLLETYRAQDLTAITNTLKDLLNTGIKPETVAESLIQIILESPAPEFIPLLAKLPEVRAPFPEVKLLLALTNFISVAPVVTPATITPKPIATPTIAPAPAIKPVAKPITAAPEPAIEAPSEAPKTTGSTTIPAPEPAPAPEVSTPAPVVPEPTPASTDFWTNFVNKVGEKSAVCKNYLQKSTYEITDDAINIYPSNRIAHSGLTKDSNKAILCECGDGQHKIVVHEFAKINKSKDPVISQISDIMGGAEEVKQDGGIPF